MWNHPLPPPHTQPLYQPQGGLYRYFMQHNVVACYLMLFNDICVCYFMLVASCLTPFSGRYDCVVGPGKGPKWAGCFGNLREFNVRGVALQDALPLRSKWDRNRAQCPASRACGNEAQSPSSPDGRCRRCSRTCRSTWCAQVRYAGRRRVVEEVLGGCGSDHRGGVGIVHVRRA